MGDTAKAPQVDVADVIKKAKDYRPPTAADAGLAAAGQAAEVRAAGGSGGAAPAPEGAGAAAGAAASASGGAAAGAASAGAGSAAAGAGASAASATSATTSGGAGATPSAGAGAGAPAAPALTGNAARWAEIERLCNLSALGRTALGQKTTYSVGINYASGTGSFYDSGSNAMTLDTSETAAESALTFIHEMNHAHYHHAGLGANVQTLGRQAYVDGMVAEEVEGTILSIEAKGEIVAAGESTTATFPMETQYHQAYQASIAAGGNAAAARAAARERVRLGFVNGEVVTSNTNASYPSYYGTYWDSVHPASTGSGSSWV
jgi:hypothetical protein